MTWIVIACPLLCRDWTIALVARLGMSRSRTSCVGGCLLGPAAVSSREYVLGAVIVTAGIWELWVSSFLACL